MLVNFDLKKITTISLGATLGLLLVSFDSFAQTLTTQTVGPPASKLSTDYREPKAQPFADSKLIIKTTPSPGGRTVEPVVITPIPPPSFEERDLAWKEKRMASIKNNMPSPSPSEKYLVDEVKILGLYQKPEGQGVFLRPTLASSTTIFAMVGQKFWNGEIKRIDKDKIEVELRTLLSTGKIKTEIQIIPFTRTK